MVLTSPGAVPMKSLVGGNDEMGACRHRATGTCGHSSNNGRCSQQSSGNAGVSQHFPHGSVVVHVGAPHIDLGFDVGVFVDEPVVVVGEFGDDLIASVGWQRRIVFPVGEQQHVVKVTGFHWSAFREWYRCRWYAAHASRHCWQGGCWLRV